MLTTVAGFSWHLHPQWHANARVDNVNRHFFSRIQSSDAIITLSEHVAQEAAQLPPLRGKRIVTIGGSDGWGGHPEAVDRAREIWPLDLRNVSYEELGKNLQDAFL